MTNFSHGRQAEEAAAEYLRAKGYEIVDQNWRNRWCEMRYCDPGRDGIVSFVVK